MIPAVVSGSCYRVSGTAHMCGQMRQGRRYRMVRGGSGVYGLGVGRMRERRGGGNGDHRARISKAVDRGWGACRGRGF